MFRRTAVRPTADALNVREVESGPHAVARSICDEQRAGDAFRMET
jgi:hypothetical protein